MTDPNQVVKYRYRLLFAKKKAVKYIGHLDLALAWERALRRAQIALAYSKGFNPRPKMQFASELPLGSTGGAEIVDIVLEEPLDLETAHDKIDPTLPQGLKLHSIEPVPIKAPTLQNLLRQADYNVLVETDLSAEALSQRIEALLAADEIIQTRRRRKREEKYDLRPWLYELDLVSLADGDARLHMRLACGQHGNLRPEAVLKALDLGDNWAEIERTRLYFEDDLVGETTADG
ncbi:MAG: TIGR03936 family radical SAM-associated protein [Anaerolineae bacterium]|nr:TIGR03936 family radical SAM-associated protein [Anaerolineae bacterium]